MEQLRAIILAAGEGKRMHSHKPKVTHAILDKPMINYVIDAAKSVGCEKICVVIGHMAEQVKETVLDSDIEYVIQKEQLGTGHAVMEAKDFITEGDVLILYGDTPLISADTLTDLIQLHKKEGNSVTLISTMVENPEGYGRIIRDALGGFVKNIEHKDANEKEKCVKEINAGIYLFKSGVLRDALSILNNDNTQREYYLPDTLSIIKKKGLKVNAMRSLKTTEFLGVNTRLELSVAEKIMKERINRAHMENGVTIADLENTYIGGDVKIGMDTIIYPNTTLFGHTKIESNCVIGPNTKMTDTHVKEGAKIEFSYLNDCVVGEETTVGPFAYVRPHSTIGAHVKVGDFVEIKNAAIGDNTKISHLTYIGDADVGAGVNFGCGTVVVNYDGTKKYRTTIEDNAFIGCNTNLISPVTVKKGAYTAAGSTITNDVPENSLAVARAKQVNKEKYLANRGAQGSR